MRGDRAAARMSIAAASPPTLVPEPLTFRSHSFQLQKAKHRCSSPFWRKDVSQSNGDDMWREAMEDVLANSLSVGLIALLPLLYSQAVLVRRRTPKLPEASGPISGLAPGPGKPLRLLVVGESTVAGVGAPTQQEALTGQLAAAMSRRCGRAVQWLALGRSGISAREARRLFVPVLEARTAIDVVVLALGVNDVLRFRPPQGWRSDLRRLIGALRRRLGPVPVILAPVPRMQYFPALPQPLRAVLGLRARMLDRAARRLAHQTPAVVHVPFVMDPCRGELFCADGFHPSVKGYAAWADQLARAFLNCGTSPLQAPS